MSAISTLNMRSNKLINLLAGVNDADGVNLGQLRSQPDKQRVRAATTANIALSATQTVDGVSLAVGDRVLVKNQTTGAENGIYTVASGAWTRSVDADLASKFDPGQFIIVSQGTANVGTAWFLATPSPITLGTTSLSYQQIVSSSALTGGTANQLAYWTSGTALSSTANLQFNGSTVGIGGAFASDTMLKVIGVDATSGNFAFKSTNNVGGPLLYIRNDGNVGIGATAIPRPLTVAGTALFGSTSTVSTSATMQVVADSNEFIQILANSTRTYGLTYQYSAPSGVPTFNIFSDYYGPYSAPSLIFGTYGHKANQLTLLNSGFVGVKTDTPTATFDVNGSVRFRTFSTAGNILTNDASGNIASAPLTAFGLHTGTGANGQIAVWNGPNSQTGSNNIFWTGSYFGIGTSTPTQRFHTVGGGETYWKLENTSTGYSGIIFQNGTQVQNTLYFNPAGGNDGTFILGSSGGGGGANKKLAINGGVSIGNGFVSTDIGVPNSLIVQGNVGIGTASPTRSLHVAGGSPFRVDVAGYSIDNILFQSTTLKSSAYGFGIQFKDASDGVTQSLLFKDGTFIFGGSGSGWNLDGNKRAHFHGGVTIGSGLTSEYNANGLWVQGSLRFDAYPNTLNSAGTPVNVLTTSSTGVVESHTVAEVAAAGLSSAVANYRVAYGTGTGLAGSALMQFFYNGSNDGQFVLSPGGYGDWYNPFTIKAQSGGNASQTLFMVVGNAGTPVMYYSQGNGLTVNGLNLATEYFSWGVSGNATTPVVRLRTRGGNIEFHDAAYTSKFVVNPTTGGVGINASNSAAMLTVKGVDTASGTWAAQFHNSSGTNNALMIRNDGKIGMGSAAPVETLHINGNLYLQQNVTTGLTDIGSGSASGADRRSIIQYYQGGVNSANGILAGVAFKNTNTAETPTYTSTNGVVKQIGLLMLDGTAKFISSGGTVTNGSNFTPVEVMTIDGVNKVVSIGTTISTSHALKVKAPASGWALTMYDTSNNFIGGFDYLGRYTFSNSYHTIGASNSGSWAIGAREMIFTNDAATTGDVAFRFSAGATPSTYMRIGGSIALANTNNSFTGLLMQNTINQTGTSTGAIVGIDYNPTITSVLGPHYAAIFRTGHVGINTATPAYPLDVYLHNTAGSATGTVRFGNSDQYGIRLTSSLTASGVPFATVRGPKDAAGWLTFSLGATDSNRMKLGPLGLMVSSGNITDATFPDEVLHIIGNAKIMGVIKSPSQTAPPSPVDGDIWLESTRKRQINKIDTAEKAVAYVDDTTDPAQFVYREDFLLTNNVPTLWTAAGDTPNFFAESVHYMYGAYSVFTDVSAASANGYCTLYQSGNFRARPLNYRYEITFRIDLFSSYLPTTTNGAVIHIGVGSGNLNTLTDPTHFVGFKISGFDATQAKFSYVTRTSGVETSSSGGAISTGEKTLKIVWRNGAIEYWIDGSLITTRVDMTNMPPDTIPLVMFAKTRTAVSSTVPVGVTVSMAAIRIS